MREIKFRAWNKILKQFVPIWSGVETRGDDVLRPINCDFILEQYTGLKDKNGVDIYEGDIVKVISQYWGQLGNKYEVTFESGSFVVPTATLYDIKGNVAVIGNIHENADLLNIK